MTDEKMRRRGDGLLPPSAQQMLAPHLKAKIAREVAAAIAEEIAEEKRRYYAANKHKWSGIYAENRRRKRGRKRE